MMAADYRWFLLDSMRSGMLVDTGGAVLPLEENGRWEGRRGGAGTEQAAGSGRQAQKDLTEFVDGNIIENERAKAEVDLEPAPPADQGPAHASRMSENPRFSRSLS
jgi:hypothetical protein